MNLIDDFDYQKVKREYSVATAVEILACDGEGGVAERAQQCAQQTAQLLGLLIETLHTGGKLSDAELVAILGGRFSRAPSQ